MKVNELFPPDGRTFHRGGPWRWIASHLAPFKLFIVLYVLGSIAGYSLSSAIPRIIGLAIDAVLQPSRVASLFLLLTLLLLLAVLVQGLLGISSSYALERIANGFERDVRDELYISLLRKGQTFFNRHRAGDLMARATDDAAQLNEMFAPGVEILFSTTLGFAVPLIFIAQIDSALLISPAIFVVLFGVAVWQYSAQLAGVAHEAREQNGRMVSELTEAISGFELIEVTGQKDFVRRRFAQQVRQYRDLFVKLGRIQALYVPPLLLAFIMAGAFLHGLALVEQGQLTIGDFIAYLGLMGMLRLPTSSISFSISLLLNGLSSARRILDVLNEEDAGVDTRAGYSARMRGELVFEHVWFAYEDVPILADVSFRVAAGQTLALVGPTGSGKTMLTKLVNRTYDCDRGRILIDGVDVREWDMDALRSQIGVIEQDVVLFSRSIADNIAFGTGKQCDRQRIEAAAAHAQADTFIRNFQDGYDTLIGDRGVTLSGGQRQRLAIARALLTDPRILILDDSTSAIDSATEAEIQKAIRRVAADRTTILITHRLPQICRADTIVVLNQGKVVDQGTHGELMSACPFYRRIFMPYYRDAPSIDTQPRPETLKQQSNSL